MQLTVGALATLGLSMLFAAGDVSPPGSRTPYPAAVRKPAPASPASMHQAALLERAVAANDPKLLETAIQALDKPLEEPGAAMSNAARAWTENQLALGKKHLAVLKHDDALLLDAIAGYRRALSFFSNAGDRQNAGIVAANLLAALLQVKNRDAGQISAAELHSLANAALAATDRAADPLTWARLQVQIGTLRFAIGARDDDVKTVETAIADFRSGLETAQNDGRPPREWAEDENLLANALEFLGRRTASANLMGQALQALHNTCTLYHYAGLDQYQFYLAGRIAALRSGMGASSAHTVGQDSPTCVDSPIAAAAGPTP